MCVVCNNGPGVYTQKIRGSLCATHAEMYTCTDCGERRYSVREFDVGRICHKCGDNYRWCIACSREHHKKNMKCFHGDWICNEKLGFAFVVCGRCGYLTDEIRTVNGEDMCSFCYLDILANDCRGIGRRIHGYTFEKIKSKRWYGVEIETDSGNYKGVPGQWGIKTDGSIGGLELVSPLMAGDEGLASVRRLYDRVKPGFDDRCGIHVHVDVRDLNERQLLDLVRAFNNTKKTWFRKVSKDRWNNEYCCLENKYPGEEKWDSWVRRNGCDRYRWVNFCAVQDHGSVELRLLEGCDVDKVVEWITMAVNFVEQVVNMDKRMDTCV